MATLEDILGGGLPAGLLSPEQEAAAQQRAQNAGLLNLAFGLLQASRGVPGQGRPGLGQIIGQAGPVGVQAYQQSFENTLANALRGMQVQEMRRQQAERERLDRARQTLESSLAGAVKTVPSTGLVPGSEQTMQLASQMEGFAPEDIGLTQKALMGAGATQRVPDEAAANRAVMDYLRSASPIEYAKLAFKQSEEPAQIQVLRSLIKDPALMEAFIKVEGAKRPLSQTSVEVKNQAARDQALFKEVDLPIVQGFTTSATSAREFAQTSDTINRLLKGAGGGKFVQVGTDVARTLGINPGQVAVADLAQSLVTQAAPRMRAPGSGSTSDLEFKSYMASIPSLALSEQGRELMAKYSSAFAERSAKLADYARTLAKKDELSFDAIQKYDQSLGSILKEDFYKFAPTGTSGTLDFRSSRPRGGQ